jgi:hypothetical protein
MDVAHSRKLSKNLGSASPKSLSWQSFLENGKVLPMANGRPESNEAVSERLRILRTTVSGDSQTAFAARLGVEVKRWNNFERLMPLSKEVAFLVVKKFPDVTLDWLFLGKEDGLSVRRQREFAEAEKALRRPKPAPAGRRPLKTPPRGS